MSANSQAVKFAMSAIALFAASSAVAEANNKVKYTYDHRLAVDNPRHSFFSPDGQFVVVERVKPAAEMKKVLMPFVSRDVSFAELTIFNTRTGESVKIEQSGILGMSAGPWSPDGKHLVLYSRSEDGKSVSIGVYNVYSREYRRLPGTPAMPFFVGHVLPQVVWSSTSELIYAADPESVLPRYHGKTDFSDHNIAAFETLEASSGGTRPSAFVYDSRATGLSSETSQEALLAVNITTGFARRLLSGMINGIALSPNGRHLVAYRLTGKSAIPPVAQNIGVPKAQGYNLEELVLVDLQGTGVAVPITGDSYTELRLPVTWSSDSGRVGFYAFKAGQKYTSAIPHVYDVEKRTSIALKVDTLVVSDSSHAIAAGFGPAARPIYFTDDGAIIESRRSSSNGEAGEWRWGRIDESQREETNQFWRVSSENAPSPAFPKAIKVNGACPLATGLHFVADGMAWQAQRSGSVGMISPRKLLAETQLMHCPYKPYRPYVDGIKERVLFGEPNEKGQIRLFDPTSPNAKPVWIDQKHESILDVSPGTGDILILRQDKSGISVILIDRRDGQRKPVQKYNEWISGIDVGEQYSLSYTADTPFGRKSYTGWYLTPPDFKPGKRYPVIVDIYPGVILDPNRPYFDALSGEMHWSAYAAAAEGYIVLVPSSFVYTSSSDFNSPKQLATATLAALDALIEAGLADPDRLAIRGHSAGGYAVASILTQTDRFKAAIASAGIYNLTSFYGTWLRPVALDPDGHLNLYGVETTETGQGGMENPPWVNPGRYIANSPVFHADKITTPLLLIHGESDTVPVQQAEEMFTALLRQQKTVRFARYLGEIHTYESPANLRHAWSETLSWLETFLKPRSSYSKEQAGAPLADARPDADGASLQPSRELLSEH